MLIQKCIQVNNFVQKRNKSTSCVDDRFTNLNWTTRVVSCWSFWTSTRVRSYPTKFIKDCGVSTKFTVASYMFSGILLSECVGPAPLSNVNYSFSSQICWTIFWFEVHKREISLSNRMSCWRNLNYWKATSCYCPF